MDTDKIFKSQINPHENSLIAALRGARNGLYYGARIRFAHSIVMQLLFGTGNTQDKLLRIIQLSWQHGRNLGLFVFLYKLIQSGLSNVYGKRLNIFAFIAGVIAASVVWREKNAVNTQLCFYLVSRVLSGILNEARKAKIFPEPSKFGYISVITWGIVMFLFERDKKVLQRSLASSMTFLYHDSDAPLTNYWDLVPINLPESFKN